MAWHAVFDNATGRLASVGEVLPEVMPPGLVAVQLAGRPADSKMWDEKARAFVDRPPRVLLTPRQFVLADADYLALNAASRTRALALITKLLTKLAVDADGPLIRG